MRKEKIRERKASSKNKINEAIAFIVITAIMIFMVVIFGLAAFQGDFRKVESQISTDVAFPSSIKLWERLPDLQPFPWNQYHKHSIRGLSPEELTFLQEKKIAECVVDMVNYDDILIQDKDKAVAFMYSNAQKLLTDSDDIYYVWNEFQIENIYLYVMVNLSGEIFSFHYVTDIECDGEDAVNYVLDNYEDEKSIYPHNNEPNDFQKNKMLFVENAYQTLKEYENLHSEIFYQDVDLTKKPVQISKDQGYALLGYPSEKEYNEFIFLYMDSKTKKVSGYHLILY